MLVCRMLSVGHAAHRPAVAPFAVTITCKYIRFSGTREEQPKICNHVPVYTPSVLHDVAPPATTSDTAIIVFVNTYSTYCRWVPASLSDGGAGVVTMGDQAPHDCSAHRQGGPLLDRSRLYLSTLVLPKDLTYLDLSHNRIRGTVPKSLEQLSTLQTLDLSYNRLCGLLPKLHGTTSATAARCSRAATTKKLPNLCIYRTSLK
ncbi:hypothetical protein QYE76_006012 [Lolium multiflorum]|uniref:Uncharacterized protein n=1 Tax=Lolium multiflorum TaxID=4521 RepID=A0AAD8W1R7_LOLMU|nr:hypothetical protein QYE76_006012 [Lolium multiflorum]